MKLDNSIAGKTNQVSAPSSANAKQNDIKTAPPKTESLIDAGKNSKLGELDNKGSQIKQNLLSATKTLPVQTVPTFSKEATVTKSGDKVIIQTNATDDKIGITQDAKTGDVTVQVNGEKQVFSGKDKDNLVIKAGEGNDTITVDKDVTVKLTLEGEKGNDEINVDKDSKTGHDIDGGDGDDKLNGGGGNDNIKGGIGDDTIEARDGNDTVDGGDGRDYINGSKGDDKLSGGAGNDVIYGGDGKDEIKGNAGDDYLEGSKGDDTIEGGKGKDTISGGIGDDTLKGGDGDDVIYAGQGKDTISGEAGKNKIFAQKDDTIEKNSKGVTNTVVTVELKDTPGGTKVVIDSAASDEFKERVEADLEMLRSSTLGRKMLTGLEKSGQTVTIRQSSNGNSATWADRGVSGKPQPWYDDANKKKGSAVDGFVNYQDNYLPSGGNEKPPVVALFHELAHNYDYTHGTLRDGVYDGKDIKDKKSSTESDVNNRERVAVGLPIDHDNKPKTAERLDPLHPTDLTENAFRNEVGVPKRTNYRNK
jgi:Ca2+-binding RTX toxin-like protein